MGGAAALAIMAAAPSVVMAQTTEFNIPAGPLKGALDSWSRTTSRELLYREDQVAGARSNGARGMMTPEAALSSVLHGTSFTLRFDQSGAVAVVRGGVGNGQEEVTEIPEILVSASRNWSLNTGIRRSRDDSQPFVILTQEDIKASGAHDLDTFLRNQLSVNANPTTSDQVGRESMRQRGLSSINLRGLGSRETLILVDGRRQAGVNIGTGQLNQAQITSIPMAAIERIEVLASSASGIYGSGASGGVVNIILKRGFSGGEMSATYADTADLAAPETRLDGSYARMFNGGRTRVSVSGSWRRSEALLYGDRADLLARNRNLLLENDPDYFETAGSLFSTPVGATPNFKTDDGSLLRLKPQYGGQTLSSAIGYIPDGYRGISLDGVSPLLATLGRYNFDQPDSATGQGARAPVMYGSETLSGMTSVRHEFNDRISVYAEAGASRGESSNFVTRANSTVQLAAGAPNNPFVQELTVSLPQLGAEVQVKNRNDQWRLLAGSIIQLPYEWQALADVSYNASRFQADRTPSGTSLAHELALRGGQQDVLRDLRNFPLTYSFIDSSFSSWISEAETEVAGTSLRLAGPAPVRLPGGRPQLTLNLEYSRETIGAVTTALNSSVFSFSSYVPDRHQTIGSAYGEVVLPVIGPENRIPLVELLEVRVAARYERYEGEGALSSVECAFSFGAIPDDEFTKDCPPQGVAIERATTVNEHVDPSVSLRWSPARDIVFRASYTTGYLPPRLDQLVKRLDIIYTDAVDPQRGNEPIGVSGLFGYQIQGAWVVIPRSSQNRPRPGLSASF